MSPESGRPWVRTVRPDARLRLFCFPYAGGGTVEYRSWSHGFPGSVDVCPLVLPGRETRFSEPVVPDMGALASAIATAIWPLIRRTPYVFTGHSMGAWLAYEVARELRRRRRPPPEHLFLSARHAPHLAAALPPLSGLSDADFIAGVQARYRAIPVQILAQPEIMKLFLPAMRADFTLLDTWDYVAEDPLDVPITAFRGTDDPTVTAEAVRGWKAHTTGDFLYREIPGGHFFLRDSPERFTDALAGIVRRYL